MESVVNFFVCLFFPFLFFSLNCKFNNIYLFYYSVPSQPENFAGESISATQILLTWGQRDTEVQIQYYDLYYNDSKTGRAVHRSVAPTRSYTLEDLKPNTVYNLWLAAKSRAGQGASTAVISVRTQESGEIEMGGKLD